MPPDIKTQFIENFLSEMRLAIADGRFTFSADRPDQKNRDTLYLLGYEPEQAVQEFRDLCRPNHDAGPLSEENNPVDQLWIFKKTILGYPIYFKILRIITANWFIGISFHVDEI